eukprot:CAMPEP_0168338014 /NCGR_PEP_ID=MMETSP0213-20121227/12554_1 /TAXON_ID=151035 /ORGANISM="Euplotes harpa, Strain FSP1.4" /LENGTH=54 /DNA_ID=CAMNT_0008343655 /DNA_START=106 /DNA_END=266 /DNA_ORIENTATION=-
MATNEMIEEYLQDEERFNAAFDKIFAHFDENNNGVFDRSEMKNFLADFYTELFG